MMATEELLIKQWRNLPLDKQQEVLDFVEFLCQRQPAAESVSSEVSPVSLGDRLKQLRQHVVDSGVPLLNEAELEAEVADRRGGIEHQAS